MYCLELTIVNGKTEQRLNEPLLRRVAFTPICELFTCANMATYGRAKMYSLDAPKLVNYW